MTPPGLLLARVTVLKILRVRPESTVLAVSSPVSVVIRVGVTLDLVSDMFVFPRQVTTLPISRPVIARVLPLVTLVVVVLKNLVNLGLLVTRLVLVVPTLKLVLKWVCPVLGSLGTLLW